MTAIEVAIVAGALAATAGLQWIITSRMHRRRLEQANARHAEAQQASSRFMQQAKKQIAQLQQELAASRLEVARLTRQQDRAGQQQAAARQVLRESLASLAADGPAPPADGFADTLPSLQFPPDSVFGTH
jgi:acetate kinase